MHSPEKGSVHPERHARKIARQCQPVVPHGRDVSEARSSVRVQNLHGKGNRCRLSAVRTLHELQGVRRFGTHMSHMQHGDRPNHTGLHDVTAVQVVRRS